MRGAEPLDPGDGRTVILGAGGAGERLSRDLRRSAAGACRLIGFLDDDRSMWGQEVDGRPVLGGTAELPDLARRQGLSRVLITAPTIRGRALRDLLSSCSQLGLCFKTAPAGLDTLRSLTPGDLLPRDRLSFSPGPLSPPLTSRVALVTGAAGSIGSEICAQLLHAGVKDLVLLDRDENGLLRLEGRLTHAHPEARVRVELGDVRDAARICHVLASHRPQDVFHAAAHKHVTLTESAPCEAVKTNIAGTRNVATAAGACRAERFVYISTDKAVRPSSVMGATKRIGEEIARSTTRREGTRCCAVRFGNVLGSAGSVMQVFREQIARGGPVSVTHPDVRRYFMSVSEAVALVLQATYGDLGELCVLDMREQIRIEELARSMITLAGLRPGPDVEIVFTGLRPGEKLFEELLTEEEERTRRVQRGILAVDCPAPPENLDNGVVRLVEAARLELDGRVVELLHEMVPSYRRWHEAPPTRAQAASPSAVADQLPELEGP